MKLKIQLIKNSYLLILSLLTVLSFILLMTAGSVLFGRNKTDLTSLHRTAMNPQSKKIAANMDSPVNITVYISENLGSEYPDLGLHSQFLFRLLERYQTLSNGKITINIKNPEPFSPIEEEAQALGIRKFQDNTGTENLYFGAVFNNEKGQSFTIPYFSIQRQNYTEYDISRTLGKLGNFKKKTIGVATFGTDIDEWQFTKQLENDYNIEKINPKNAVIPSNIKVLLVYNPQQIPDAFIYALDQYIMRGGKVILLVDPYSEQTIAQNPTSALHKHKLLPLLNNLGFEFDPNEVVGDKRYSFKEYRNAQQNDNNVLWFDIPQNNNNNLTYGFLNFSFRSPGTLGINGKGTVDYQPIFSTSSEGGVIPADFAKFASRESVNHSFPDNGKEYTLGYWATGWFESLFEESIVAGTEQEYKLPPFIIASIEPATILIIADSDFITDDTWNLAKYKKNSTVYDQLPGANNADFLLRAIDIMSGNSDIAGLYPNYLMNSDKSISEQIYNNIFTDYAAEYIQKEKQISDLTEEFENFKSSMKNNEVGLSISKIQEIENYHRRIQKLQEELKFIEYRIKTANEYKTAEVIVINTLVLPFSLILLLWFGIKIYNRQQKQKVLGLINE